MSPRGFVVSGPETGVGKTTLSVGLMRAYADRGEVVQPFKVGPDFIDPTHHRRAAGRASYNLDGWMVDRERNRERFRRRAGSADVAIVEGVMGLFDGAEGGSQAGSTAEMARWLDLPVVLVVDVWRLGGSVAPLVEGFTRFDSRLEFAGVILNRVAGSAHAETLVESLSAVDGIDVVGALPRDEALVIPERHLGLELADESGLSEARVEACGEAVEEFVDLEELRAAGGPVAALGDSAASSAAGDVRLGVARDEAFQFYYGENFDRLEEAGAELVEFSPLAGEWPREVDGLYIGGGYPELAAERLASRCEWFARLREFAREGGPVYAECGGLMLLGEAVETTEGERFEMAGLFPWTTRVSEMPRMDYAEVEVGDGAPLFPTGTVARGHFFHYSKMVEPPPSEIPRVYSVDPERGESHAEGYAYEQTLASYVHLHFGSHPGLAVALVEACDAHRESR